MASQPTSSSSGGGLIRSSILAPSKFGSSAGASAASAGGGLSPQRKPSAAAPAAGTAVFQGLKQSKLSGLTAQLSAAKPDSAEAKAKEPAAKTAFLPLTKSPELPKTSGQAPPPPQDSNNSTKPPADAKPVSKQPSSTSSSSTNTAASTGDEKGGGGAFVFGENLSERASNFEEKKAEAEDNRKVEAAAGEKASTAEEPSGAPSKEEGENCGNGDAAKKSLSESAAEYSQSHAASKRRYEEVEVRTGEEDERNVVQLSAKLHVFDKAVGNWAERGRGVLRLNDKEGGGGGARLVMRTSGSLRVILNTPLYRGMTAESPSEKTVRLTGSDDGGHLKVFLVTAGAPKDAAALLAAIRQRIAALQEEGEREEGGDDAGEGGENDGEEAAKKRKTSE